MIIGRSDEPTGNRAGRQELVQDPCADELIVACADLLPGDVLLYRPACPNFFQQQISKATTSPYTHAAIYLGEGEIGESITGPFLRGVQKANLEKSLAGSRCVAVLRTQVGFLPDRVQKLKDFVGAVIEKGRKYDLAGALSLPKRSQDYFGN